LIVAPPTGGNNELATVYGLVLSSTRSKEGSSGVGAGASCWGIPLGYNWKETNKLRALSPDGKWIAWWDEAQPAGVNLEFEMVGVLPPGRWDENGFMNARSLNAAIDTFCRDHPASKPLLDKRRIDRFWVEAGKKEDFPRIVEQINSSPLFTTPPVKCET
jgi:hypothetical protein